MSIGEWLMRRSMSESSDDGTIGRGQICWDTSSTHSERKPDAKSLRFSFFYVLANEKGAV